MKFVDIKLVNIRNEVIIFFFILNPPFNKFKFYCFSMSLFNLINKCKYMLKINVER